MPGHLLRQLERAHIRHTVGKLSRIQRVLAVGAIASVGVLVSHTVFVASAEADARELEISLLQSYEASATFDLPAVERDEFAVSQYSLVQWPVPSTTTLSSGFGYRSCVGCSSDHLGIDLNPGSGYPVEAIASGVVVFAEESDYGLGVHVIVEHVIDGAVVRSLYGHMQFGSLTVGVGDTVTIGQKLGLVGSTGQSSGAHLHFGILRDGVEIDPLAWLNEHSNV